MIHRNWEVISYYPRRNLPRDAGVAEGLGNRRWWRAAAVALMCKRQRERGGICSLNRLSNWEGVTGTVWAMCWMFKDVTCEWCSAAWAASIYVNPLDQVMINAHNVCATLAQIINREVGFLKNACGSKCFSIKPENAHKNILLKKKIKKKNPPDYVYQQDSVVHLLMFYSSYFPAKTTKCSCKEMVRL